MPSVIKEYFNMKKVRQEKDIKIEEIFQDATHWNKGARAK